MSESKLCPLCKEVAQAHRTLPDDTERFGCKRCGTFRICHLTALGITDASVISGYTRLYSPDNEPVSLTEGKIAEIRASAPTTVWEKSKLLLRQIEKQSKHFGDVVTFNLQYDYPLAYAKNQEEFRSLLKLLSDSGFIESCSPTQFVLKADGIRELESWRNSNVQSEKAFVAMSFAEELRPIYFDCIAPTVIEAGYRPVRIDLEEHNDDIVARVLIEIREAKFVVAEFTSHRNGVYFEAGFAKGLGLEVIWLCRADDFDKAHFDTKHFNHIVWSSEDDLRGKLLSRIISSTVGPGPLRNGSLTV